MNKLLIDPEYNKNLFEINNLISKTNNKINVYQSTIRKMNTKFFNNFNNDSDNDEFVYDNCKQSDELINLQDLNKNYCELYDRS